MCSIENLLFYVTSKYVFSEKHISRFSIQSSLIFKKIKKKVLVICYIYESASFGESYFVLIFYVVLRSHEKLVSSTH